MSNPPVRTSPPRPRRAQVLGEHVARPPPWHVVAGNLFDLVFVLVVCPLWFWSLVWRLVAWVL